MKYYTAPNMSKHVACVLIVKDNQELLSKKSQVQSGIYCMQAFM